MRDYRKEARIVASSGSNLTIGQKIGNQNTVEANAILYVVGKVI
jgi:hypothetical protein